MVISTIFAATPAIMQGASDILVQERLPLWLVGLAATFGAILGLKAGIVRYKAALLMAAAGMALAPLGVRIGSRLDNRWLGALFAVILPFSIGALVGMLGGRVISRYFIGPQLQKVFAIVSAIVALGMIATAFL